MHNGDLKYLAFSVKDNASLPFDFESDFDGNDITATLPDGIDLTKLKPMFKTSTGKLYLNGKEIKSGTAVDFSKTVKLSADKKNEYTVNLSKINTGIPSLCITTQNYEIINSKTEKKNCNMFLAGGDTKNGNYAMPKGKIVKGKGTVKNRGWSSWYTYPKKSYTLKLKDNITMLGLPAGKEWVLAANYNDVTIIRNAVAAQMAYNMGMEFVMDIRFVDLWVNGNYNGSYQLIEKIEVDKNRVNITKFKENLAPDKVGYLLEINGHNNPEEWGKFTHGKDADRPSKWKKINNYTTYDPISGDIFFTAKKSGRIFNINKPSDSKLMKLSENKRNKYIDYIYNYLNAFENAVYSDNYTKASKYMDMTSLAKWYCINEMASNNDSQLHCSCYMYKDVGKKMKMGPLWDFDGGYGNYIYANEQNQHLPFLDKHAWFEHLLKMPQFKAEVKKVWNNARSKIGALDGEIVKLGNIVKNAQELNYALWDLTDTLGYIYPQYYSYDEQINYMRRYVKSRTSYMDRKVVSW